MESHRLVHVDTHNTTRKKETRKLKCAEGRELKSEDYVRSNLGSQHASSRSAITHIPLLCSVQTEFVCEHV